MAKDFAPAFGDLDRDIERHLERFGRKEKIMGATALFGLEESRRAMFDAYVEAGKNAEIAEWLFAHWYYLHGTNQYFDEFVELQIRQKANGRLDRLWRHVWLVQLENYTLLKSHPAAGPANPETQAAHNRLIETIERWRAAMRKAGGADGAAALEGGLYDNPDDQPKPLQKPDKRKIDESLFWHVIGEPLAKPAEQVLEIAARLESFAASQIKAFDKLLRAAMQKLNRHDLWALAYLRNGGCSDDSFESFRAWTILQGAETTALARSDPLAFLEKTRSAGQCEGSGLLLVPAAAYFRRAGKTLPRLRGTLAVHGEPWDEATVEAAYPALAAACARLRR